MRAEVLKGHLDGLLLAALEAGPQHGYALIESLRAKSDGIFDLPTGTVYPALHRLERAGFVTGSWLAGSPRPRRVYKLTATGRRALKDSRNVWTQFSTAVTAVLDGKTWPAGA
jgi:PadR family transcriptional regulator, regulatory protein PadR